MTKKDLVQKVAAVSGISSTTVESVTNTLLDAINDSLRKGENIEIRNFATFKVVDVAERTGRNITTGESVIIPAHKTVKPE